MKKLAVAIGLLLLVGICGVRIGYELPQEKIAELEDKVWALESYINHLNEADRMDCAVY